MDNLPVALDQPQAVLLDTQADVGDVLIIVWEPRDRAARDDRAKAAVRLNFRRHVIRPPGQEGIRRRIAYSNALRTTGYVSLRALRDSRYVLLWGELE